MTYLLAISIKVAVIILVALMASIVAHNRSAAVRHWVLSVGILCATALPLLELVVPSWGLSSVVALRARPAQEARMSATLQETAPVPDMRAKWARAQVSPGHQRSSLSQVLEATWLGGIAISLGTLLIGLARLRVLASHSQQLRQTDWTTLADRIAGAYGVRRQIRLLESDRPTLIITWGVWRPKVVVPAGAREWTEDRIRIVLSHELAHVQRCDWLLHMIAGVLRSLYWFNPLLWIAARRLRLDSEHACDDAVLSLGIPRTEYANELVGLARTFSDPRLPAAAIARSSSLERRVRAMLDGHVNRYPIARSTRLIIASILLALALPIAGAGTSSHTGSAMFSGFVFDPTGAAIPAVTVTLSRLGQPVPVAAANTPMNVRFRNGNVVAVLNFIGQMTATPITYDAAVKDRAITVQLDHVLLQQALAEVTALGGLSYRLSSDGAVFVFPDPNSQRYEARTDSGGYFQFVGLPAGNYFVQVQQPGFAAFHDNLAAADGVTLRRNVTLQLGEVVEAITVADRDTLEQPSRSAVQLPNQTQPCVASPDGGKIVPPRKIRDVRPEYPLSLHPLKGDTRVVLEALIGTDGLVKDVRATTQVDPEVERAAIAAVGQWQFTPTYLNCIPTEVRMTVNVTFTAQ
jgi:beta-lactamase regulating signal transducer with metallopeptidase domain